MDLRSAIVGGLQSTKDAFDQDIDKITSGRSPQQLISALQQILTAPASGMAIPKVPQYKSSWTLLSPDLRKKLLDFDRQFEAATGKTIPSNDILYKSGNSESMLNTVLQHPWFGKIGELLREANLAKGVE